MRARHASGDPRRASQGTGNAKSGETRRESVETRQIADCRIDNRREMKLLRGRTRRDKSRVEHKVSSQSGADRRGQREDRRAAAEQRQAKTSEDQGKTSKEQRKTRAKTEVSEQQRKC